jgi:short-subunit dehydrogenase involved in D-alanine esterification of teichoic acids
MQSSGNTVLIAGGGSGIGSALARAQQQAGSQRIVAGRRK